MKRKCPPKRTVDVIINGHNYRPQTKFGARSYFQKRVSRILFTGGGCLLLGGGAWSGGGVPAPGGVCSGGAWSRGCLLGWVPGLGGLLPGGPGYCCGRYASYWNAFLFVFVKERSPSKGVMWWSVILSWAFKAVVLKLTVYDLRIHLNLSVQTSNPKINLPRWKSTRPDFYSTNIFIIILNTCIERFNKFLFIMLNINQFRDKISAWLTQVGKCQIFSKISTSPSGQVS